MSGSFDVKLGILDPTGVNPNPLTGKKYSENYLNLAKIWSGYPTYLKAEEILGAIEK